MEYYCHKKEWNNAICSDINRPRDYHTNEVNQTDIYNHLYVESKKYKLTTKQKHTHKHRKQTYGYQRRRDGGGRERGRGTI